MATIPYNAVRNAARNQFRRVYDPITNQTQLVQAPYFNKVTPGGYTSAGTTGTSPSTAGTPVAANAQFLGATIRFSVNGTWTSGGIINYDLSNSGRFDFSAVAAAGAARDMRMTFGDFLNLNMNKAGGIEWVHNIKALPDAADAAILIGCSGSPVNAATDTFPNAVASFVGAVFQVLASGVVKCCTDDNTTNTIATVQTSEFPALAAGSTYVFRIEWDGAGKVFFFINGVQVCKNTSFTVVVTSNTMRVQPYTDVAQVNTTATVAGVYWQQLAYWSL